MAKRVKVGSVVKGKEGKPDYIQITGRQAKDLVAFLSNVSDNDKVFINLESKKAQLDSLDAAVAAGKLKEDYAEKQRAFAERIPDFVRFELVAVIK